MNVRRKISWVLLLVAITGVAAGVTGCSSVLAGYNMDYMHARYNGPDALPKPILDDVQKFVRSEKIPQRDISDVTFGQDDKGRHVAVITREFPMSLERDYKEYILYYNKDNERTKIRTFRGTREETNPYQKIQ